MIAFNLLLWIYQGHGNKRVYKLRWLMHGKHTCQEQACPLSLVKNAHYCVGLSSPCRKSWQLCSPYYYFIVSLDSQTDMNRWSSSSPCSSSPTIKGIRKKHHDSHRELCNKLLKSISGYVSKYQQIFPALLSVFFGPAEDYKRLFRL